MKINDFKRTVDIIQKKYEDRLTNLRYTLLKNPKERAKVVEFLDVMNRASSEVIDCMSMAVVMEEAAEKKQCLDYLAQNLPEYFYFLEIEGNFHRKGLSDPPVK
jgi:hypothetical protein